jgi:hypothetical protein
VAEINWLIVPNAEKSSFQIEALELITGFYLNPSSDSCLSSFLYDPVGYLAEPASEGKRPSFAGFDFTDPWDNEAKALLKEALELYPSLLRGADLAGTKLDIDLGGANLEQADLRFAHLSKATLEGAVLRHALMEEATLTPKQVTYALQQGAFFSSVQREGVVALDSILGGTPNLK